MKMREFLTSISMYFSFGYLRNVSIGEGGGGERKGSCPLEFR